VAVIEWTYESDSFETFCWAEMERKDIVIVRTDDSRWRWRVEVPMKGRRPTGECATLDAAKKNALAAYRYVSEAERRDAGNQERAAVVAWLRSQAETTNYRPRTCPLADAIERGEHCRKEEA
jgi:hypothetical protein